MRAQVICVSFSLLLAAVLSENYCGRDFADSKNCQNSCPSGMDQECPSGERCFGNVPCPSSQTTKRTGSYCGRTFELSKSCTAACPSNTNRECAGGETCFADVPCSATSSPPSTSTSGLFLKKSCGRDFADSKKCEISCPSGIDQECPSGERCFASVPCPPSQTTKKTGSYCGRTFELSKSCTASCPSNTNRECTGGETCYADVPCSETSSPPGTSTPGLSPKKSCGRDFADSKKCEISCPSGIDKECPSGERCFASVPCPPSQNSKQTGSYCGRTFELSKSCSTSCPSHTNSECTGGETCYADVPCSGTSSPPSTSTLGSSSVLPVSGEQFEAFFPARNTFYTYSGLVSAAVAFPGFMRTGSQAVRRREAAAFLANVAHESGDLKYIRELAQQYWHSYCDSSTAVSNGFSSTCQKNGRNFQYFGRGPIQLSWNFNYLAAGLDFGIDLINNPEAVATDASVSWKTAIWFWMRQKGAGSMTPHDAIVNGAGFGETIRSINGALECNGVNTVTVTKRVNKFQTFAAVLGAEEGPGDLRC